uniref:Uncharacterized protein n=1 Tax=Florenciella sp. virus SA2 TaxID=3240092 RepID=A0AB39JF83_9VIRU
MIHKYINFKIFLLSFSIGVFYVYITDDYKQNIVVYPTPLNLDKKMYVDKSDNCFKYNLKEVPCPANKKDYIKVGANY